MQSFRGLAKSLKKCLYLNMLPFVSSAYYRYRCILLIAVTCAAQLLGAIKEYRTLVLVSQLDT